MNTDTQKLALLMIEEITRALHAGTVHIRKSDNKTLTTHEEIISALLSEGKIEFISPKRDSAVRCGYCGAGINLKRDYGHYDHTAWNNKYKCESCHYRPGHQYE